MKHGCIGISCDISPEGEDSDDLLLRFKRTDGDYMITIHAMFPGTRNMKGMMKITPERANALSKFLELISEDDEGD